MNRDNLLDQITSALVKKGGAPSAPPDWRREFIATAPAGVGALRQHVVTNQFVHDASIYAINEFAAMMISSMHLAGLDRRYGSIATELDRISTALVPQSANVAVDFPILPKLQKLDARLLTLADETDARSMSAELYALSDTSLANLLSSDRSSNGPFSFQPGMTDPSDVVRKVVGANNGLSTASVHTYLGLTLCDPYAYGVSGSRSVLAFVASLIIRTRLRESGSFSQEQWPVSSIDKELMKSPELLGLLGGNTAIDSLLIARATSGIAKMESFKELLQCIKTYSADSTHLDANFHALYTVLKACYIVHFATDWLTKEFAFQMQLETDQAGNGKAATASAQKPCEHSDDAMVEIRRKLYALMASLRDVSTSSAIADDGLMRLKVAGAYRLVIALNAALARVQRACTSAPGGMGLWVNYTLGTDPGSTAQCTRDELLQFCADCDAATSGKGVAPPADLIADLEILGDSPIPLHHYTAGTGEVSQKESIEASDEIGSDEITRVGALMCAYGHAVVMNHRLRAPPKPAPRSTGGYDGDVRVLRFYRMRAVLMFIGRVYSFLYQLDGGVQTNTKTVPRIVAMLRTAGWHSRESETGAVYLDLYRSMFARLTTVMASGLLLCNNTESDDTTRCMQFSSGLLELRDKNLRLMSAIQRKIYSIVPSCHPFMYAQDTQLTLPASIVAQLLPTGDVLPPDWSVSHVLYNGNVDGRIVAAQPDSRVLLQALLGERAFKLFEVEQRASISLIDLIAKKGSSTKTMDAYKKTSEGASGVMRALAMQNSAI
jgi:hypothetical protein